MGRRRQASKRKTTARVQGRRAPDPNALCNQLFTAILSHITDGSTIQDVDPDSCISLYLSRPRWENAVRKLKAIINGQNLTDTGYDNNSDSTLTGFVSGSPTSVVVPLVGNLAFLLDEHFESLGLGSEDVKAMKSKHEIWHGVVDGCQLHGAIMGSRRDMPAKWESFRWKVFVVKPGLPIEEYEKLARVQNERCKQANHYEPTMFDLLKRLRQIHDRMLADLRKETRREEVTVIHRDVACAYDGGDHDTNTTIKQAVSIALRLSPRAIDTLGTIMSDSCAEVILNCSDINTRQLTSTDDILSAYDCRLYKNFLCPSTIRGSANFINALKDGDEEAQINTIHRARHCCELSDYKRVKSSVLTSQFKLAKLAIDAETIFLKAIGKSEWPANMTVTRDNLLRSTVFDEELLTNRGNDRDVIRSIWHAFKTLYPSQAKGIEVSRANSRAERSPSGSTTSAQAAQGAAETSSEPTTPPTTPPTTEDTSAHDEEQERLLKEEEIRRLEEEKKRKEVARKAALAQKADFFLTESGITTHTVSLDGFIKNIWRSGNKGFDMILGNMTDKENMNEVHHLPALCRATLKRGSYIALVIHENQFAALRDLFSAASFKVCDHTYKVLYDPKTMKRRRNLDFPQRLDDICFIAKSNGAHPTSFVPDFASCEEQIASVSATSYASVQNMQACSNKLKFPNQNSPIFPTERSMHLFMHLIRLFSPSNGAVLDPFGGPLSVAIACLKTDRTCLTIQRRSPGLKYAVGRLRVFATPDATLANLESFVDESVDTGQNGQNETVPTGTEAEGSPLVVLDGNETGALTANTGSEAGDKAVLPAAVLDGNDIAKLTANTISEVEEDTNTPSKAANESSNESAAQVLETHSNSNENDRAQKRQRLSEHVNGKHDNTDFRDDVMVYEEDNTDYQDAAQCNQDIEGADALLSMRQPTHE